ncbi:MAG: hypothetical protein DMG65_19600 [Candidatus Angelobacter sp. Gp1-AA117]|nr:MAG: hypothetical protein DMG65_19600 [Candidatus Angelobacter sp. Gp1-AA117]
MAHHRIANYLLTHRKKSGLTQEELARLVGYRNAGPVSRQERGVAVPSLFVAFTYSTIFQVSISELFPGITNAAKTVTEARLADFEDILGRKDGRGRDPHATGRKLEFLCMRKQPAKH